jgi:hypothetical protein
MIGARRKIGIVAALAIAAAIASGGCSPESALDFGPSVEISTAPEDQLSRDILRDYAGKRFFLTDNDHEAHVSLAGVPNSMHIVLPYWLGVNPLYPGFLRPTPGHIYVISQATLTRPIGKNDYLIRAGSKLFKSDTVFEATHTRYVDDGGILPTIVRFVGTRVITVPKDAPATGTITEKVPVLREVSLPMQVPELEIGYAKFEVIDVPNASASPTPGAGAGTFRNQSESSAS